MNKLSETKAIFFLIIVHGLFFGAQQAQPIELTDVRTGFHRTYSRVVLEFNSEVKFQVIKDVENGAVIIDVLDIDKIGSDRNPTVHPDDIFLKSVSLRQSGQLLSVAAILKRTTFRIDHFYMRWPFRIVIDIYRDSTPTVPAVSTRVSKVNETLKPEAPVENSLKKDSLKLTDGDSAVIQLTGEDSLALMTTPYDSTDGLTAEFLLPFQQSLNSVKTELQKITGKRPPKKTTASSKNRLVIAIITGFLLLDGIILVAYLKARSRKNPIKQAGKEKQVLSPLPPTHKFAQILQSALDRDGIEEVRKQPDVIKKQPASRHAALSYESWKSRMTPARKRSPATPDLKAVAKDLGSILSATTAAPQLTKEELIGKDGAEFLENLRRHTFS